MSTSGTPAGGRGEILPPNRPLPPPEGLPPYWRCRFRALPSTPWISGKQEPLRLGAFIGGFRLLRGRRKPPGAYRRAGRAGRGGLQNLSLQAPCGKGRGIRGTCAEGDGNLLEIFEAVAKTGKLCAVHAENDDLIRSFTRDVRAGGGRDLAAHGRARPPLAEVSAVAKVLAFARSTGVRLGICHVSTPEAMELIRREKAAEGPYMRKHAPVPLLRRGVRRSTRALRQVQSSIRKKADSEALWKYVRNGTVDYIGSDHGPFLLSERSRERRIFLQPRRDPRDSRNGFPFSSPPLGKKALPPAHGGSSLHKRRQDLRPVPAEGNHLRGVRRRPRCGEPS